MSGNPERRQPNRLQNETSPYLRQHAYNPVDWYPWGQEALQRASREDRPILLSIGYSACHWCHVMERESFENAEIAALMNEHFVCIKADREERPDLDAIYMNATVALNNGRGGWPMTVFLTPDQRPFFAGTYFPPEDRGETPGLPRVLRRVSEIWTHNRTMLLSQAEKLTEFLQEAAATSERREVGDDAARAAVQHLAADYDPHHGGFGPAPKFPDYPSLMLLLSLHSRSGDPYLLRMVTHTLDSMAAGGIFDQIGGGFARYATDSRWLIPHFEKMLYDNALLARLYLAAFQVTGNLDYERVARQTLDFVVAEMTGVDGGFVSSLDADSEADGGELKEGAFYVWTPAAVAAQLGQEETRRACAYYAISNEGNFDGSSVPSATRTLEAVAADLAVPESQLAASLTSARRALYEARQRRPRPRLDDKVLTAWNGLMIGTLAEASRVLTDDRYLVSATAAAVFLRERMQTPDGRLLRSYRDGQARLAAYLDDYAYLCDGLIDLYEACGDRSHLNEALRLSEVMLADFASEEGSFYTVARDHEKLLVRTREGHDGPVPNPNAVAAAAFARLAVHADRTDLLEAARRAIEAHGESVTRMPRGFCTTIMVADFLRRGPTELVLCGSPGEPHFDALRREVSRHFLPHRALAYWDPSTELAQQATYSSNPLFAGKGLVQGKAALYVCRDRACDRPVLDPEQVSTALHQG